MLDPWFITGFTDGEGCFSLFVRADRQKRLNTVKVYYRWQVDFAYTLRGDDIEMLNQIKEYFGCGKVSLSSKKTGGNKHDYGQGGYHVVVPTDLIEKIIPHFENYPLKSKKMKDFEIWKQAVRIIKNAKDKKQSPFDQVIYTPEEHSKLVEILEQLKFRLTGGHITQKRTNPELQGKNEVIQNSENTAVVE